MNNTSLSHSEDQHAELIRLENAAVSKVFDSPTKFVLVGIAAFAVLAPVAFEVAAMAGVACVYAAVKRAMRNGANAAYIRDTGNFAFVLGEAELIRLVRLQGKETVTRQIQAALADGQFLSPDACEFLEVQGLRSTPLTLAECLETDAAIGGDRTAAAPAAPAATQPSEPAPAGSNQPIGINTRLGAVTVPAVGAEQEPSAAAPAGEASWLNELIAYPAILIWGAPGSGKSTLAEWLIRKRLELGHQVEILDPHREFGQWDGLPVYGDGMDYEAINRRLAGFSTLVKRRYQDRAKNQRLTLSPHTVLAEEFTQWSKKCEHAPEFFEITVSDIRKINCHAVYVSHNRTLSAMGGAKGLAATRDAALLEVELFAQVDPVTKKATPTGKGKLRYPGGRSVEVAVPNLSRAATPTQPEPHRTPEQFSDRLLLEFGMTPTDLGHYLQWKTQVERSPIEPRSETTERLNRLSGETFTNSEPRSERSEPLNVQPAEPKKGAEPERTYTARNFTRQQISDLIDWLRDNGQTQQQIIEGLWRVRKGGSDAWKQAREEYRQITGE